MENVECDERDNIRKATALAVVEEEKELILCVVGTFDEYGGTLADIKSKQINLYI